MLCASDNTLLQGLEAGHRAHGYVTGVKDYGVFIAFCGGVKGLVPQAELGLEPNQDATTHFPNGKVCFDSGLLQKGPLFTAASMPQSCLQGEFHVRASFTASDVSFLSH